MPGGSLRWILEDALAFARREVRRGSRYAGIVLDPPHHGRGPKGERWQLEQGLARRLTAALQLLDAKLDGGLRLLHEAPPALRARPERARR